MAIIWYEHFDTYGLGNHVSAARTALAARGYSFVSSVSSGFSIVTTGRNGRGMTDTTNGNLSGVRLTLPSALPIVGAGVAMNVTLASNTSASKGFNFAPAIAGANIRVIPNASLGFNVYTAAAVGSNTATLVGSTPPNQFTLNSWFWVEAKVIAGSPGSVVLRINGNEYTFPVTTANIGCVGIGGVGGSTLDAGDVTFDDWVVWDDTDTINNNFLGDTWVLPADPDADGAISQFAPSSGTNRWSLVDERDPSDADYITANSAGDANEFSHVALNLPVGAVAAIATQTRAFKTDAGASSIRVGLKSASQTSMSSEMALSTGATVQTHIANRNPNGDIPWTQAAAQAAQLRIERVS